ncbi:hypothetical protein ABXK61_17440 [Burkholderia sola]|uniref:hypothetical protein n=1 Tax=Burkholderia TaxID=32008 RepID=UPI001AE56720|nr:hypothetical protein [Burkholderia sp. AcTa6-5]MBP0715088.1 hypothetical protein [Burkholderia sp. AcTa6-5]
MGQLALTMPIVSIGSAELKKWGEKWLENKKRAEAEGKKRFAEKEEARKKAAHAAGRKFKEKEFNPSSISGAFAKDESIQFGSLFDRAFGEALAKFLGSVPVVVPNGDSLLPPQEDCVEVGLTRIVGGIRPQNYDAAYRPDGPRVAFDSKSLNDKKSIGKNWQNMINDLATEAATIHTRFPYAVVAFMVILPKPALEAKQQADIVRTLERLGTREHVLDQHHLAEAIALIVWEPETGEIDQTVLGEDSVIGLENFSQKIARCYKERYKGLPPHGYVREAPGIEHEQDLNQA